MFSTFALEGGLPLVLARAASVAALLSVFGTLVFERFVARRCVAAMPEGTWIHVGNSLLRTERIGVAAAIVATLGWLVLQAGEISGAASATQLAAAIPVVVSSTAFGRLVALQLATLLALAATLGRWRSASLPLAFVATVLQARHSHASAMYGGPSLLLASDALHLLAAGAWLGGLLPLLLLVGAAPPQAGALAARWFSPLGKWCLGALVVSAGFQGWVLVGSVPGLVGTAYGGMVLVKLALFGVLVGFAVVNRYWFAPALMHTENRQVSASFLKKRRKKLFILKYKSTSPFMGKVFWFFFLKKNTLASFILVRSIALQTAFGLAILVAAAMLSSLPPAMHEQPLWPFAERFTLETIGEDPAFRNEVLSALLALAAAVLLVIIAFLLHRRVRVLAVGGAAAIAWFAIPHLDLLFVPAYPTSYYASPTGFSSAAIVQGAALFPSHCATCHGADGQGGAEASNSLPPADLTAAHLWMHSDGELFWWLSHGIDAPEGGLAMPGFAAALSEEERWDLIDYIRAHNVGVAFRAAGSWSPPVQAPELQAECANGRNISLADLHGGFVRLVFGTRPPPLDPLVTTILVNPDARPQPGLCVAADETLARAYAIVSGLPADKPLAEQFLIDGSGWLRAAQPAAAAGWDDPLVLSGEIRQLEAHPIGAATGGDHAGMRM